MNENIDKKLTNSAEQALDNEIPDSLLSASIELKICKDKWFGIFNKKAKKEIQWLCVFDKTATENDFEFGEIAGSEIIADFSSEFGINEMFEKNDLNQDSRVLKNVIYQRLDSSFTERETEEQKWIIENNYCEQCEKTDTGLNSPIEYKFKGKLYVKGNCKVCGNSCLTEIETIDD